MGDKAAARGGGGGASRPSAGVARGPAALVAYAARARLGTDVAGCWVMAAMLLVYMRTSVVESGCGLEVAAGMALPDFPCGAAPLLQVLHVVRNAPFYAIVRPLRLGDWACLAAACGYASPAPLLTLVAATSARASSRVWLWYRDLLLGLRMFLLTTLLHAASYLLLPRDQWLRSGFAAYSNAIVTRPIADALSISHASPLRCRWPPAAASCRANSSTSSSTAAVDVSGSQQGLLLQPVLLNQMPARMQLLVALLYTLLPAAVCFVSELHVRRSFTAHMQQQAWAAAGLELLGQERPAAPRAQQPGELSAGAAGAAGAGAAGPNDVSDRNQELQSARRQPLAATLSRCSEPHAGAADGAAAAAGDAEGSGGGTSSGSSGSGGADSEGRAKTLSPAAVVCRLAPSGPEPYSKAITDTDVPGRGCQQQPQQPASAAARPDAPPTEQRVLTTTLVARRAHAASGALASSAACGQARKAPLLPLYQGLTSVRHISVKVQHHPGSFEDYSQRLLAAAPNILAARSCAGSEPAASAVAAAACCQGMAQSGAVVVRGCALLLAWRRGLADDHTSNTAGGLDRSGAQAACDESASWLLDHLPWRDAVRGVAWHQAAVAGLAAGSSCGSVSGTAVGIQLLHLAPPVLQLSSTATGALSPPAPEPLRLRLVSPQPQRARLLVVGSSGAAAAMFAELQVQLCGGEQELELGGEVLQQLILVACAGAAAGEAEVPNRRARALQLLLVPPLHDDDKPAEGSSKGGTSQSPPLLHFTAPLLVLPAAAAAELCGLWGQVVAEADGDAAAAHAALQPLLSDLSYVLEAAEAEGQGAAAAGGGTVSSAVCCVAAALQSYLRHAGLAAAPDLVADLSSPGASNHSRKSQPQPQNVSASAMDGPPSLRLRLARAAPFLLAMTAQPYLLGLIRTVVEQPRAVVVQTLLLSLALWVTDILGSLVLLLRLRSSLLRHYSQLYHVACIYVAPALFLAASIASRLRPLPSNRAFVGNPRVLIGSALSRGLVLPNVQQLGWRQAAAAAVLLAPGEALQVAALQPDMHWGWVAALVVGWRLAATATSAAWEWRARSHFVALRAAAQHQAPHALEHTEKVKSA
ncbi:hypothetical protein HXX76_008666 [Chlamydomonas incerta]|uniref:Uncharacterized protein n=1 Tax=Chlamydomonas incerta TaxID=51695 RepID=A0A835STP8_CHLIN|nr:hypothetical protein HXX76_008666 [Chlamydomonas incerta]|eukprot:KAG2432938.1 hypothetical protein HXX76_008666 [Chlamydomonas incerta]